jgi:SAM-dependent methyltransferase
MSLISIRNIYSSIGVEAFYSNGAEYYNPHSPEIIELLSRHSSLLPLERVLDLACGPGLVTTTLQRLGYTEIKGLDPFLNVEYSVKTGRPAYRMSFKDIVQRGLPENFSCIICSFALHLCPISMLPDLLWRLSEISNTLVIISPSKFPLIGKPRVEKFCLTRSHKRVQFRVYDLPICPNSSAG